MCLSKIHAIVVCVLKSRRLFLTKPEKNANLLQMSDPYLMDINEICNAEF